MAPRAEPQMSPEPPRKKFRWPGWKSPIVVTVLYVLVFLRDIGDNPLVMFKIWCATMIGATFFYQFMPPDEKD